MAVKRKQVVSKCAFNLFEACQRPTLVSSVAVIFLIMFDINFPYVVHQNNFASDGLLINKQKDFKWKTFMEILGPKFFKR